MGDVIDFAQRLARRAGEQAAGDVPMNPVGAPRLGAASLNISISDADGFRVVAGGTGDTIIHLDPLLLQPGDWDNVFRALTHLENTARMRQLGEL
jgi:hypothetical protein